jgi:hypothetical protein
VFLWCAVIVSTPWVRFFFGSYLLFLIWVAATVMNPADPDLWHRLAVGEFIWRTGHFPPGDAFSYLSDYQKIADHEWGSAVLFYGLWHSGGGGAMVATKLLTLTATLALVVVAGIGQERPAPWMASFYALVLLALLPSFQSAVRCLVFTHILLALWVWWFRRERRGRPLPTFLYVVTMVIWANLHGGFVIGLLWLLSVALVEAMEGGPWQKWLIRFVLCTLATLINPFSWHLWIATGRALNAPRGGFSEWAPVSWTSDFHSYLGFKVLFLSVLAALAVQLHRKGWRQLDRSIVILIGISMVLAMTSARHTSLFAVIAGGLLPALFPAEWVIVGRHPLRRLGLMAINSTLILIPFYTALRVLPGAGMVLEYPSVACPVGAVAYLQGHDTHGKLLVPFNYGSYALWELRGKMRVSMDGRYDLVYRPETYRRVDDFFAARGEWTGLLTLPAPDAILTPRADDVYLRLQYKPAWKEVYRDEADAVFIPR